LVKNLQNFGSIKYGFQIIRNVDGHMKHVDVSSKSDYNFAFVSDSISEDGIKTLENKLKKSSVVVKHEVFSFKTNSFKVFLMNSFIKLKGLIVDDSLVPSKESIVGEFGDMCGSNKDPTPRVMINVIKHNKDNKADMDIYSEKCIFELFPRIGSYIFHAGSAMGDYWDQVALMHYESTEALCKMANSEEYMSVYEKKVTGLLDTHTYLTKQLN